MRGVIAGFTMVVGVAGAQADTYPAEHTARPLLLPSGGIEGTAALEVFDASYDEDGFQSYAMTPAVRYGLTNAEVEAGVTLGLYESDDTISEPETLRSVDVAARLGIGGSSSAGAELQARNPAADFSSYLMAVTVATRRHLTGASLDLGAAAGYTHATADTGVDVISLRGRLAATAQLSPVVALQARAELYWYDYTESPGMGFPDFGWFIGQQYGLHALVAASPSLDVFAGFDMLSTGEQTVRLFTLGVAGRRVP